MYPSDFLIPGMCAYALIWIELNVKSRGQELSRLSKGQDS